MFSRTRITTSTGTYSDNIGRLKKALTEVDTVVIGAGAGLSTSAGFVYKGERFEQYFFDFAKKYHFSDMYSGGFYPYTTQKEFWAYWSRYIWVNRYMNAPKPVYDDLLAEVFELVQMEMESRRQFGSRYSGRGVFASRIVCADCGGFYGSKVWHSNDPYRTLIWRCNRKYEKVKRCTTPHVKEEAVKAGFVQVMTKLLATKQEVLEGCRQILNEVLTTDEQARQIAKLQDQAVGLAQRIRGLVNENARTQMTEDEFTPEYDRLVSQYEKLAAKIAAIQREKEDKEYRAEQISLFMRMLARQEECLEFDPTLFTAFVEKVVISGTKKDVRLVYVMRDGSEYKVDRVR